MKYGDYENANADIKTLRDIMARQGASIVLDCLAEFTMSNLVKFKCSDAEKLRGMDSLLNELKSELIQRL